MKKTGVLKVIGDIRMPFNRITVNSNDGYDLDILAKESLVKIHANVSTKDFAEGGGLLMEGHLVQGNDCKLGTVELNTKTHSQIGKPEHVTLLLVNNKLLIIAS